MQFTIVDILIILIVVAIAVIAIRWVLAQMGVVVPDALIILAAVLVLLLIFSGQCGPLRIGLGGR